MKKIIITIDGESHILVGNTKGLCGECSLYDLCWDKGKELCCSISESLDADLYPDCVFKKLEDVKN